LKGEEDGPVFAAVRAARAVGWEFTTAIHITSHIGEVMNLREGSPAMVRNLYRQGWVQVQGTHALSHRLANLKGDEAEGKSLEEKGLDPAPVKRCLTSKGIHGLDKASKTCLLKFLSATGDKHSNKPYPNVANLTARHTGSGSARTQLSYLAEHNKFDGWLNNLSKDPARTLAYQRGWFVWPTQHKLQETDTHEIEDHLAREPKDFMFVEGVSIYADGSGYYGSDPSLATAGLALLQDNGGFC
jgi:hypothetical protein